MHLGEPHQTGIGERHGRIGVARHEQLDGGGFGSEREGRVEQALTHFTDNFRRIAARSRIEETRFREHRLTRNERGLQPPKLVRRPFMPLIGITQPRDQRPRIEEDDLSHLPKSAKYF
ncbi:MAG: hypothetical protein RL077_4378 [Verrucomicrobiota bacterium]